MAILFAVIGIVVGGSLFRLGGAVFGGLLGWLCGELLGLRRRVTAAEHELTALRGRAVAHEAVPTEAPVPATAPEAEPELIVLTDHDLVADEEPAPATERPAWNEAPRRPKRDEFTFEPLSSAPSQLTALLRRLAGGENLLVKLGVLILFFGVSFLVKYAAQHVMFPLELRLASVALGGCALLAVGWRLRHTRPVYAQVIQGGGVGTIYLTTYAAMRLYHLIPTAAGFGLLVAACALVGFLAVAQDARPLAVMGCAGGFLAPELAALGSGSHLVLFGYYTVLNCGVLGIARYRAWRELNIIGFVGTFAVGAMWGSRFYRPELFPTVEPFLVLFFLIYAVLPWLHADSRPDGAQGYLDVALVFGTPIAAFALQRPLVRGYEYGLSWSALVLGAFYLLFAGRLFRSDPVRMRRLTEAFLALGTLFTTLAIPLALDGRWTAAAWSAEGAALVWIGLRQARLPARVLGYLLLIGSGIAFMDDMGLATEPWPILNGFYTGCLMVSAAALVSARLLNKAATPLHRFERRLEPLLFAWGMLWWFGGGLHEISEHAQYSLIAGAYLTFLALTSLACDRLRMRLSWRLPVWPALGLLPVMGLMALAQLLDGSSYPSVDGGWFGWPVALGCWFMILRSRETHGPALPAVVHAAPLWLLGLLGAWELSGRVMFHLPGMETWALCAWGVVPALLLLVVGRRDKRLPWPAAGHLPSWLVEGCAPLAAFAWLWIIAATLTSPGDPWPLPYLPLLNPLDVAALLVLTGLVAWYRAVGRVVPRAAERLPAGIAPVVGQATLFIWLNGILLRTIHHWCGVPFTSRALYASLTVQTTLSVCWSLAALALMTLATRRGLRRSWLAGAGLLGAVVVKLFLVDLAGHGSVARIVSFVVVGILVLVIGWFAPVPPRAAEGGVQ